MTPDSNSSATRAVTVRTDGGARGNPGPAGIGFTVEHGGTELFGGGAFIGAHTNNVAEYAAIIWGVENALGAGYTDVTVLADSELVVKQLNGQYRVKHPGLKPLYAAAIGVAKRAPAIRFQHIPRAENAVADAYANGAMDGRKPVGSPVLPFTDSSAYDLVSPPAQGSLF